MPKAESRKKTLVVGSRLLREFGSWSSVLSNSYILPNGLCTVVRTDADREQAKNLGGYPAEGRE